MKPPFENFVVHRLSQDTFVVYVAGGELPQWDTGQQKYEPKSIEDNALRRRDYIQRAIQEKLTKEGSK